LLCEAWAVLEPRKENTMLKNEVAETKNKGIQMVEDLGPMKECEAPRLEQSQWERVEQERGLKPRALRGHVTRGLRGHRDEQPQR
jgi:hypothetical protein